MLLTWQNTNANAFSPLNNPSTLTAFYLPGVGQTNSSGKCSAWADQSGNGNTLNEGAAGKGPTINADGSLTFNGVDMWLKNTFVLAQPSVITLLISLDSTPGVQRLFDGAALNSGAAFTSAANGDVSQNAGLTGVTPYLLPTASYTVFQVVFNGASSTMQRDNLAAVTNNAGTASMSGFTLGGGNNAGVIFQPSNITVKGLSIRNATSENNNNSDLAYWMRIGGLS